MGIAVGDALELASSVGVLLTRSAQGHRLGRRSPSQVGHQPQRLGLLALAAETRAHDALPVVTKMPQAAVVVHQKA